MVTIATCLHSDAIVVISVTCLHSDAIVAVATMMIVGPKRLDSDESSSYHNRMAGKAKEF